MKRHHVLSFVLMVLTVGFMASCATDGFDDESFSSDVRNTQLASPVSDEITVTPNADGSRQTIAWPLVKGARGFEVKILNVNDPEQAVQVVDSIVDGYSVTIAREEDTNYELTIRTLANAKLGNSDAQEATTKSFTTFAESYALIPDGTDLYQYFLDNPVPGDGGSDSEEYIYDLVAGGSYTVSAPIDFNYRKVMIRTSSKSNYASLTLAEGANFIVSNDFSLNYMNIDCSATSKPFIELLKYDTDPDGIMSKPKNYYLIEFVRLMNCKVTGVNGSLVYDNNKSWAVVNFIIKNAMIQMSTTASNIKNESFISFQGGGVKDFSIVNSTVWQTGDENSKYFLRYNNSIRIDRLGWTTSDHTTLTYNHNTFYKVSSGQWANYSGIQNYTVYDLAYNIWYDCADGNIARRMMGNGRMGSNGAFNSDYNTYWYNGAVADQANYDTSATQLTTDPAFVDPANANFTPTGAQQVEWKAGDPRWFATAE